MNGAGGSDHLERKEDVPMLQTLSELPPVHIAYLIAVVTAFSLFGVSLGVVHIRSNLPDRRP